MKKWILRFTLVLIPVSTVLAGYDLSDCTVKKAHIRKQIDDARSHANYSQRELLSKMLAEAESSCTKSGLLTQREQQVKAKERQVAERIRELIIALESGSTSKIDLKMKKLEEGRRELLEAKAQFNR